MGSQPWMMMRSHSRDSSVKAHDLAPGTTRRVLRYATPYRRTIAAFLLVVLIDSVLMVAVPLLIRGIIDDGITPKQSSVVIRLSLIVAAIAVAHAISTVAQRWFSARIGEGLIYDLRRQVFAHVLRQPIGFFTRTQTGALVSRVNNDVMGAQQAFTSVLSGVVSNVLSVALVIAAMTALSWQLTLAALALVPLFIIPARLMGARLAALTKVQMETNAELGARMTERFNVAGALLVKLFGRPVRENTEYAERAEKVRDAGVRIAINRATFLAALTLVASLASAMVYGVGGLMAISGSMSVGTLLALAALLSQLYGPLTSLSNVRVDVMTALISFERIFEVLDLSPLVTQSPSARPLPAGPLDLSFDQVAFNYPGADEISLVSLEASSTGDRRAGGQVLHNIDLHVPAGTLLALVGPSGAGKTTLTSLIPRLFDPTAGAVRLGGLDLREATLESVTDRVGMVTQDAHLFHDSIRSNLAYAQPGANEGEMIAALKAAQIWPLVKSLPAGLDTVVGDRGHRLSGGEKQRLAIARILLKAPDIVVLDEATAHLDSESEVAVQAALETALTGRTAVVIAHRLSTIRSADAIAVLDEGTVVQYGTHEELLAAGGLYATLYHTQFREQGQPQPQSQ